jgi:DNA-binding NarL/FixJ family response regulator
MPITILLVDDHPFCRDALDVCVQQVVTDALVIGLASLAEARLALSQMTQCDLLVLDLDLGDSKGVMTLMEIRREWPDLAVLVVSGADSLPIQGVTKCLGARGFQAKTKPVSELANAVRAVLDGELYFDRIVDSVDIKEVSERASRLLALTPAQRRVLKELCRGAQTKTIAHDLSLSEVTVKVHIKNILSRIGVSNRTQAVVEVLKMQEMGIYL